MTMKNDIFYEWVVEHTDKYGDIECTETTTLKEWREGVADIDGCKPVLTLTRNVGNDDDGLIDREYAYPVNGKLPEYFDGGSKVPAKYAALNL